MFFAPKMKFMTAKDLLLKTSFGHPDALYDYNLSDYFIDHAYWESIIKGDNFYIIGRKGTGKSAIYKWLEGQQSTRGAIVQNLSFNNFPFEKLLKLEDDDFSRPNQYQSIWRYIILTEFCKMITIDQREKPITDTWKEIAKYINFRFGRDATELHSFITNNARKTSLGLSIRGIGGSSGNETSTTLSFSEMDNIREINARLTKLVFVYLNESNLSYYLQFDQLDDNYTLYLNRKKYFEALISLFKVLYEFNNKVKRYTNNCKGIAYLRTDIFKKFSSFDPDSSKFDYHAYYLSWVIKDKIHWKNPELKQFLNLRIKNSTNVELTDPFSFMFDFKRVKMGSERLSKTVFEYILNRTFHRPRDFVQYCLKVQKVVRKSNEITRDCIYSAEKEYSDWLLDEISNEISPILGEMRPWYNLLRIMGKQPFSFASFNANFVKHKMHMHARKETPKGIIGHLYNAGVLVNIKRTDNVFEIFDIVRNENSEANFEMHFVVHKGLHKGLNLGKSV